MRQKLLLLSLVISFFTINTFAQKTGILTVNAIYKGVLEGYDHLCKTMVYVDGKLAGETSEQLQSEPNACAIKVTKGNHNVRVVNMTNYEGNWEEHTITNDYSIDALYESEINFKKELTINLVFDITEEKTFANLK